MVLLTWFVKKVLPEFELDRISEWPCDDSCECENVGKTRTRRVQTVSFVIAGQIDKVKDFMNIHVCDSHKNCWLFVNAGCLGVNVDVLPRETATATRGHTFKLKKRYCRTATRQAFFSYRVVDAWNSLPNLVVTAPSIGSFKSRLDRVWSQYKYETLYRQPLPTPPNKSSIKDLFEDDMTQEQLTGRWPKSTAEEDVCMYVVDLRSNFQFWLSSWVWVT